jgi:hypothetical protein
VKPTVAALLLCAARASASSACTTEETEAALSAFKIPESTSRAAGDGAWKSYKLLVNRYGACNDGFLGELWDELNIQMLGKQWEAAMRFTPLRSDTSFRKFVERFEGESTTWEECDLVRKRATKQCTVSAAAGFCKRIRKMFVHMPRSLPATPKRDTDG